MIYLDEPTNEKEKIEHAKWLNSLNRRGRENYLETIWWDHQRQRLADKAIENDPAMDAAESLLLLSFVYGDLQEQNNPLGENFGEAVFKASELLSTSEGQKALLHQYKKISRYLNAGKKIKDRGVREIENALHGKNLTR